MELYKCSSSELSWNCVQKLLEAWTLIYLEYFTTSNAPMRVRLIMSCPVMVQTSISYSQATAEVVESSLPISPELHGTNEIREGGSNITTSVVVGADYDPTGVLLESLGESEEESMDSSPDLVKNTCISPIGETPAGEALMV